MSVLVYGTSAVSIRAKLKQNVFRFGYGVNFRYEGMLAHSFDRFYVVTRVELPEVSDLNLTMFQCTVRILFRTCIYINIKQNIMRKQYIISWKRI